MPKVSVIIPVYNVAPYILRCIESVANQTFTDFEAILVDDCGADASIEIATKFIAAYDGPILWRILHHERNRGLSAARNSGIYAAKGESLYFLDSDDWITKNCLELLVGCLIEYPESEIVFSGHQTLQADDVYVRKQYDKPSLPDFACDSKWIRDCIYRRDVFSMTSWNRLVNCNFVRKNSLFFPEGFIHEDEVWNFNIAKVVTKIALCKHNTYVYCLRNDSIVGNRSMAEKAPEVLRTCSLIASFITCSESANEQVLCVWSICREYCESDEVPLLLQNKFRQLIKSLSVFTSTSLSVLLKIYAFSPKIYWSMHSIPKLNGWMNIQMHGMH